MPFTVKSINRVVYVMQGDKKVREVESRSAGKKYIKFLTSGGCFNGEIPNFMFNGMG